jgi:serine/threonine-protein kinase
MSVRSQTVGPAAGLAGVIEKCLARDPKERFTNAASMRQALKAFC